MKQEAHIVGLTGGIGSGKTTIANELRLRGYSVYNSDVGARNIINNNNMHVRKQIEALFGSNIYVENQLNRAAVAKLVFQNPTLLAQLNHIIHPAVKQDITIWAGQQTNKSPLFVESAILFESGFNNLCYKTIAVVAPENIRIQRVIERDQTTVEAVRARLKSQLTDEERSKKADIILCNDGKTPIKQLVINLLEQLQQAQ